MSIMLLICFVLLVSPSRLGVIQDHGSGNTYTPSRTHTTMTLAKFHTLNCLFGTATTFSCMGYQVLCVSDSNPSLLSLDFGSTPRCMRPPGYHIFPPLPAMYLAGKGIDRARRFRPRNVNVRGGRSGFVRAGSSVRARGIDTPRCDRCTGRIRGSQR